MNFIPRADLYSEKIMEENIKVEVNIEMRNNIY